MLLPRLLLAVAPAAAAPAAACHCPCCCLPWPCCREPLLLYLQAQLLLVMATDEVEAEWAVNTHGDALGQAVLMLHWARQLDPLGLSFAGAGVMLWGMSFMWMGKAGVSGREGVRGACPCWGKGKS